jgi:hypothetical protein
LNLRDVFQLANDDLGPLHFPQCRTLLHSLSAIAAPEQVRQRRDHGKGEGDDRGECHKVADRHDGHPR